MVNVEAKLRIKGKNFEVLVDVDRALQLRRGVSVSMDNILAFDQVFYDIKKGLKASVSDLQSSFGTTDIKLITEKIVKQGEVQVPAEYKKKEHEEKFKQVVEFLAKNTSEPKTGKPHTSKRIEDAIKQAGINIENKPIEQQISRIIEKLAIVIPIKIETKKLKIRIPAIHTGKAYSLISEYKEKEEWLDNGDLSCIINLPAGLQMEFYDKLNSITHGSAIVEEVK